LPGTARHRHGCGMASRRRSRDGNLAGALARLHGCRYAGLVGDWLPDVQCDLRAVLQLHRLARSADDRHLARPPDHLDSDIRKRARDLGREPATADVARPRGADATVLDFKDRHARKHADYLTDDGERVSYLLCAVWGIRRLM